MVRVTTGVSGTSGNPRAERIENELINRYAPGISYSTTAWFVQVQEYIENEYGYKPNGNSRFDIMKRAREIAPIAHDIIKQNLDDIFNGKINSVDAIKYNK